MPIEEHRTDTSPPIPRLLRVLIWLTRPDFVLGIALGIGAAIAGQLALSFATGWYVLIGLLALTALLCIGAFVGYFVASAYARRIRNSASQTSKRLVDAATKAGAEALSFAASNRATRDPAALNAALFGLGSSAQDIVGWAGALIGRALAFGRLAALLGAAISFAIFLATYMQVEKLEYQNKLMDASNHLQEAARRNLLASDIEALDKQLPSKAGETLPESTIANIVNLSVSLRPYRFLQYEEPDTYKADGKLPADVGAARLSDRALSAERGRLVLKLVRMAPANLKELAQARPDFSRADLRSTRLSKLNFAQLFLSYSDLRDVEGFLANFQGAQLPHADFSGAELLGAKFSRPQESIDSLRRQSTDLRNARFTNARLNKADFSDADLSGADFSGAVLFDTVFNGARLTDVHWADAALTQADNAEQLIQAQAAYAAFLAKLPEKERSRWLAEVRTPGPEHKYLGVSAGQTQYLFIKMRK